MLNLLASDIADRLSVNSSLRYLKLHCKKINELRQRIHTREHVFAEWKFTLWNYLPESSICAPSKNIIELRLKKFLWLSIWPAPRTCNQLPNSRKNQPHKKYSLHVFPCYFLCVVFTYLINVAVSQLIRLSVCCSFSSLLDVQRFSRNVGNNHLIKAFVAACFRLAVVLWCAAQTISAPRAPLKDDKVTVFWIFKFQYWAPLQGFKSALLSDDAQTSLTSLAVKIHLGRLGPWNSIALLENAFHLFIIPLL